MTQTVNSGLEVGSLFGIVVVDIIDGCNVVEML